MGRNLSGPRLSDGAPAPAPCSLLEYQDQGKAWEEAPVGSTVTPQVFPGPEEVEEKGIPPFCPQPLRTRRVAGFPSPPAQPH